MRISSGYARGFNLKSPKSDKTRPATDASRLALFSSLGSSIENACVLDLFAGTGSYGLEALSHGAKSAVFIEKDRFALDCLRENALGIKKYLKEVSIKILAIDCFKYKGDSTFDFIFLDPPYAFLKDHPQEIFDMLLRLSNLQTTIVLEAPFEFEVENKSFEIIKRLGKKSKGKPTEIIMRVCQAL